MSGDSKVQREGGTSLNEGWVMGELQSKWELVWKNLGLNNPVTHRARCWEVRGAG